MRPQPSPILIAGLAFTLTLAGCGDGGDAGPFDPAPSFGTSANASPRGRIESNFNLLLPPGAPLRASVDQALEEIDALLRSGDTAAAVEATMALIDLLLGALEGEDLSDPPGPATSGDALAGMMGALLEQAGLDVPDLDPAILDGSVDGAVAVASPSGDTVVTTSLHAGVGIPAGALSEPVLVVIQRRSDLPCLPLDPSVPQFEGCFEFGTTPQVTFATEVTVGVCLEFAGIPVWDDLRLHRFDPDAPELGVSPLPNVPTPSFINCSGFASLDARPSGSIFRVAARALKTLTRTAGNLLATPLYAIDVGGGGLAINFSRIGWAEDNRIAFTSTRFGNPDILVGGSDGKHTVQVTTSTDHELNPKWSPDGSKIAFARAGPPYGLAERDVWVMDADGTNQVQLTTHPLYDQPHDWSPDGDSIVFSRRVPTRLQVWVMAADGSNAHMVVDTAGSGAYSPDGTRIAVEKGVGGGDNEIAVVNTDGSGMVILTSAGSNLRPAWSPDGSRIAFTSDRDGNLEIYVMNADGSAQTRLTNHPGVDSDPTWSADGGRIAFTTNRDGDTEIYLVSPDGSWLVNVTNDAGADQTPAWKREP